MPRCCTVRGLPCVRHGRPVPDRACAVASSDGQMAQGGCCSLRTSTWPTRGPCWSASATRTPSSTTTSRCGGPGAAAGAGAGAGAGRVRDPSQCSAQGSFSSPALSAPGRTRFARHEEGPPAAVSCSAPRRALHSTREEPSQQAATREGALHRADCRPWAPAVWAAGSPPILSAGHGPPRPARASSGRSRCRTSR